MSMPPILREANTHEKRLEGYHRLVKSLLDVDEVKNITKGIDSI
jgi:hypothetical protein